MPMNTNLMLISCAVLVILGGVSLAAFMNNLGEYKVLSSNDVKFQLVQDNDIEVASDLDDLPKAPY
jgi:hypothetical protein